MKKLLLALTGLVVALPAFAELPDQPWYVGGLIGNHQVHAGATIKTMYGDPGVVGSEPDTTYTMSTSEMVGYTFVGGMRITDMIGVEAQFSAGTGDVSFDDVEVNARSFGIYSVFHFGGDLYVDAKLGFGGTNFNANWVSTTGTDSTSVSKQGYTYGMSIGQSLWGGAFEISYMSYPDVTVDQDHREFVADRDSAASRVTKTIKFNRYVKYDMLSLGYIYRF